jgi:hypothetical protein
MVEAWKYSIPLPNRWKILMPASLDDILTTQKNGVVAINGLAQNVAGISSVYRGGPQPAAAAGTSVGTIYTVPTGQQFTLTDIEICNASATASTFTIYLVASGGTAGTSNALFYNAPINPNTTVQWTGSTVLSAGGTVQVLAGATTVTIKISGGVS